jgi:hypothetical protein
MPVPIVTGLINFITDRLNVTCWDGEVPRYDPAGTPITPAAAGTSPSDWPVVKVYMEEAGFTRDWTFEDPYTDRGDVTIKCWGTSREQLEAPITATSPGGVLNRIEALLAKVTNWPLIALGGPADNPYFVVQLELRRWYCGQEEGVRTADSELLYRGDLYYDVILHGAVNTS